MVWCLQSPRYTNVCFSSCSCSWTLNSCVCIMMYVHSLTPICDTPANTSVMWEPGACSGHTPRMDFLKPVLSEGKLQNWTKFAWWQFSLFVWKKTHRSKQTVCAEGNFRIIHQQWWKVFVNEAVIKVSRKLRGPLSYFLWDWDFLKHAEC